MKQLFFFLTLMMSINAFAQIDHWETVIYENNSWRYLVPTGPVSSDWVDNSFDDSNWAQGQGGFGYGDGDDNTVISATLSCYQRRTFQIVNKFKVESIIINIDYDDAFVVYLNGTEVARDNITSTGQPAYNQAADGWHEAELYQGGYPAQIEIHASQTSTLLNQGANVIAVQSHNQSLTSSDMSSRVWVHLGIKDNSQDYGTPPSWFVPPTLPGGFGSSDLPIVVIETNGQQIPDSPKITARMGIINNGPGQRNNVTDPFNEYDGFIGIERRGSTSGWFPKKQYGIETRDSLGENNNVPLFGWRKENDWVLYAPYSDKSLMRNVLTYGLSNKMGQWAPHTQFCELVLNGEYMGVYVFMEKIKEDKGRVNIAKLTEADTVGDALTGGYIVKIDKTTGGSPIAWVSPYAPIAGSPAVTDFQLHDPDWEDLHPKQRTYIQNHVTDFESALNRVNFRDSVNGYLPYIDVQSFIDFFISNEISKNVDGYRLSTFFYKEKDSDGGKIVMGPLWDFNLAWGNANYCLGGETWGWELDFNNVCGGDQWVNPFWWNRMIRQDPAFANAVKCRWEELRMGVLHTDSMLAFVDTQVALLAESQVRNFNRWPILGTHIWPNNFVGNTYTAEINYLKNWIRDRMTWLDNNMFGECGGTIPIDTPELPLDLVLYPNPAKDILVFEMTGLEGNEVLSLFNALGQRIHKQEVNSGKWEIPVEHLASGVYFYSLERDGARLFQGKWMKY